MENEKCDKNKEKDATRWKWYGRYTQDVVILFGVIIGIPLVIITLAGLYSNYAIISKEPLLNYMGISLFVLIAVLGISLLQYLKLKGIPLGKWLKKNAVTLAMLVRLIAVGYFVIIGSAGILSLRYYTSELAVDAFLITLAICMAIIVYSSYFILKEQGKKQIKS